MNHLICTKCNIRPATNTRGTLRCEECHYRATTKVIPCVECGTYFKTSNNSTRCHSCAYKRKKELVDRRCPKCDALIDPRSKNCAYCRGPQDFKRRGPFKPNDPRVKPIGSTRISKTQGYVEIKTEKGWLREHVHVMEEYLGRRLFPGESVHHKNGQRADNQIENLELWTKNQPAGQRVEDLLTWADEIIARYR